MNYSENYGEQKETMYALQRGSNENINPIQSINNLQSQIILKQNSA